MRILDGMKIEYKEHCYEGVVSGEDVASALGENPARVFKTLVTTGKTGEHYVFMVPVTNELDLKKAASAVGEKSVEMLKSKELLPLTGYVHGGCSPIGMKKSFVTVIDKSAKSFDEVFCSGGKIGLQIELKTQDLEKAAKLRYADIIK